MRVESENVRPLKPYLGIALYSNIIFTSKGHRKNKMICGSDHNVFSMLKLLLA